MQSLLQVVWFLKDFGALGHLTKRGLPTVLPTNSCFLGPGISRELEISQLLIHCFPPNSLNHYNAYTVTVGNP